MYRLRIDLSSTFPRFGPRFPAMTHPYDPALRKMAMEVAKELKMEGFVREGVYCHLAGPSYETPFESRFLKLIGCDAVGMSTAPEVVVAKHCGMAVLGKTRIATVTLCTARRELQGQSCVGLVVIIGLAPWGGVWGGGRLRPFLNLALSLTS